MASQVIDPQRKNLLDKLYSQTLSRTYINSHGYRIMLSIAYGKNQSDAFQMHKPEICYPAQGFVLLDKQVGTLALQGKPITAVRLQTKLGQRIEPVTYWTVIGDHVTQSDTDKKLTEIRYALGGKIPDGVLVRLSSIDPSTRHASDMQNRFANDMIAAIAPEHHMRFAGDPQFN
jgi:EpsI family protein